MWATGATQAEVDTATAERPAIEHRVLDVRDGVAVTTLVLPVDGGYLIS